MKMENFMEFIRAELISIFSIYENEKLCGIRTSHPIYFWRKKKYIILRSIPQVIRYFTKYTSK